MIIRELTDDEIVQLQLEWKERIFGRDIQSYIRLANLWYYTAGILNEREAPNGAN